MEKILLHNPHAGEILKYEFLEKFKISENTLAKAIGIPYSTIKEIIEAATPISADIDLRLCRYFGLSEGYFLRLQNAYELMEAKRKLGKKLNQINPHPSLVDINALS